MLALNQIEWKSYLSDIRFWIILFFIVRLYGITNPPLEGASTWRQCDGLMIARNFYEIDSNILFPRVDLAGEKTGITGSEFPILNYLIFLVSKIFGFQNWYGRLINLIISSIGTLYFYKILTNKFNKETAFNGSIILMVSMWFSYSRILIPDIFSASLCIIAIHFGIQFLEKGSKKDLIIFTLTSTIGCLAKISAACLLTVLLLPFLDSKILIRRKIIFVLSAILTISCVCLWYFMWVPYLNNTYEFGGHFFMGQSFKAGLSQHIENWRLTAKRFYDTPLKYTGFLIFITGLIYLIKKKEWSLLRCFIIPFFSLLIVAIVSGWGFYVNSYYPVLFVPTMVLVIGAFLSKLKPNIKLALILIISIENIANQVHVFTIRESMKPYEGISSVIDSTGISQNDLIAINSNSAHDPTPMYFAHRKGWGKSNEELQNPSVQDELRSKGCKFVIMLEIDKLHKSELNLERLYDSGIITIYKL